MKPITPKVVYANGVVEVDLSPDGLDDFYNIDDLRRAADLDEESYALKDLKANVWHTAFKIGGKGSETVLSVPNPHLTAYFEPRVSAAQLVRDLKGAPRRKMPRYPKGDDEPFMLELDLFDLHVGMLAWAEETGDANYNRSLVGPLVMGAVERMLQRAKPYNVERVIIPMGNDLLHTDGAAETTTAGTRQDTDSRYLKMFRGAVQLMVAVGDRARRIAPVTFVVIPGNHDRERSQYVGEVLAAWYRNDPAVEVDNTATLRKYVRYGVNLLGLTHGSEEADAELPMIMAAERPQDWAATEFRAFHRGHLHKKHVLTIAGTFGGVEIVTIPSLCPPDAYHASKGYIGLGRAAEAYLWGKETGPAGSIKVPVKRGALEV